MMNSLVFDGGYSGYSGYGWLWLVEMDRLCGGSLARIICAAGGNEPRDKW